MRSFFETIKTRARPVWEVRSTKLLCKYLEPTRDDPSDDPDCVTGHRGRNRGIGKVSHAERAIVYTALQTPVPSHIFIFVTALFLGVSAGAAGYYDSPLWTGRVKIRAQLAGTLAINHNVIPYSSSSFDTSDALKIIDQDPANTNNVILLYTQRSEAKTNFARAGGWNRGHIWPNSYGIDDDYPAYSDLHNLRPEDEEVNAARGNKYFDTSETSHASYRFPAHAEAPQCSTDFDSWSPPDAVKGDIARAIFYMDLRYASPSRPFEPYQSDLTVLDSVQRINSQTNFMGKLSTLLRWHELDPVDDAERRRNGRVESIQGNRNPFVDRPDLVRGLYWPIFRLTAITNLSGVVTDFHIQWPADFTDAVLVSSSTLTNWSLVGGPFFVNDEFIDTFLRPQSGVQVFRLRLW
jgi:endonuclease I